MPMGYVSAKPQSVKTSEAVIDAEAQKRKLNRERLMAKAKKRAAVVPMTPEQKRREIAQKRAERAENREVLAMHSRWKPGRLGGSEKLWSDVQDDRMTAYAGGSSIVFSNAFCACWFIFSASSTIYTL